MTTTINASTSAGLVQTADTSGSLALQTANTTALTVDGSQNIGIGTASPAAKLHVSGGQSYVTGASGAGAYSRWFNNAQTTNDFQVGQGWASASDNIAVLNNNANAAMVFGTNGTERMRVPSDGGVRIAMENYGAAPSSTNWGVSLNNTGAGSRFFGQGTGTETQIEFGNRNGTRGSIQTNSTNTLYNTTSDYRLKENVAPMTGALTTISALKPCTYTWKVDGSDGQGFIAHELAEVVPDCVSGEKDAVDENGDIKPQCIDTSFLVATLTAALQETKALIDTQAETLSQQATLINALTARVETLENK